MNPQLCAIGFRDWIYCVENALGFEALVDSCNALIFRPYGPISLACHNPRPKNVRFPRQQNYRKTYKPLRRCLACCPNCPSPAPVQLARCMHAAWTFQVRPPFGPCQSQTSKPAPRRVPTDTYFLCRQIPFLLSRLCSTPLSPSSPAFSRQPPCSTGKGLRRRCPATPAAR